MKTKITNSPFFLNLEIDGSLLMLSKRHIVSVETIKGDLVRITTLQSALHQINLHYKNVIEPSDITSARALKENISHMLNTGNTIDLSTLYGRMDGLSIKLDVINASISNASDLEITSLGLVTASLNEIRNILDGAFNHFKEPMRTDETDPNLVYKGYVQVVSTGSNEPLWAIQRIKKSGGLVTTAWANGNRDFVNKWDNRIGTSYFPG